MMDILKVSSFNLACTSISSHLLQHNISILNGSQIIFSVESPGKSSICLKLKKFQQCKICHMLNSEFDVWKQKQNGQNSQKVQVSAIYQSGLIYEIKVTMN